MGDLVTWDMEETNVHNNFFSLGLLQDHGVDPPGNTLRHMKKKEVIGHRQHGLTKGKSCLQNLFTIHSVVAVFVNKGRDTAIIYLDLTLSYMASWSLNCCEIGLTDGPFNG
ncbi:rna-directed dna polymerase from mobile element jockey-like [Willisornis vidua]|uniref:Rna-directed dna polymerase from mobile element jockey-like n=1 Tax=Willisornis vidua TaxID=1566151 RepID=A0ABQ9DLY9_9PASS|nr:rna-directed dna polymerase from mobile element jockey-like [Willisornis vidua]